MKTTQWSDVSNKIKRILSLLKIENFLRTSQKFHVVARNFFSDVKWERGNIYDKRIVFGLSLHLEFFFFLLRTASKYCLLSLTKQVTMFSVVKFTTWLLLTLSVVFQCALGKFSMTAACCDVVPSLALLTHNIAGFNHNNVL